MNNIRLRWWSCLSLLAAPALLAILFTGLRHQPAVRAAGSSFTLFESGQVRPLAISPDGSTLFAANTPDNRLEVFRISELGLEHLGAIQVGLEPVAVAARSDDEVWVVNHLSDSISIVRLESRRETTFRTALQAAQIPIGRVVRTLLVGDEPRDIVFAGPERNRAFITAAHRGQNAPFDPQLTTPGIGRADVWVFDAANLGQSLGGAPISILTFFTDTPRALAVSSDGSRVFAAGFHTGNRSTVIFEDVISSNGGLPEPTTNFQGRQQPETSLIVKFDGQNWVDETGRIWDDQVRFSLPDQDVFVIDATSNPPTQLQGQDGFFTGVGTVLFNMAVNPVNGKVYVSNTEAVNEIRFEGPGSFAGQTVRGHLHESRITILDGSAVAPRHLNKHIDYGTCCAPIPNDENSRSLAFPQQMAVSQDGATLYVAAFGSSKIGVFDTGELETDSFVPSVQNHILLSGGGPGGLVLDAQHDRLYALTRFDNSISVVDTETRLETAHIAMHNPEPREIVEGRRFLYDASFTSSHGDSACASCHVFGDFDSLAWDLGDPDNVQINNPGPFTIGPDEGDDEVPPHFRPLKGPMTTQSLRGMDNHGPMHWRGDRTGGNDAASFQPNSGTFDEDAAFKKFNPPFQGLLGRNAQLSPAEMQAFTDFILQVVYPPNPVRNLDNSLTADQQAGRDLYFSDGPSDGFDNCNGCHVLDPSGNAAEGVERPGFFGSDGRYSFEAETQFFKVPHLRNMYQKVGMFGMPRTLFFLPESPFGQNPFMGDQVRGFGFLHDGSVDTLFRFHSALVFVQFPFSNPDGFALGPSGDRLREQVVDFMFAFPSNLAPIVGQQITLDSVNSASVSDRIDLLRAGADAGECDLIAKGRRGGFESGFLYQGNGMFKPDTSGAAPISDALLRGMAGMKGSEVTYTCAPPGSGQRMALDRDEDGVLDGDELRFGSDPADADSRPRDIQFRPRAALKPR